MVSVLWLAFGSRLRIFRNRRDLIFENFVLRPQLTVLEGRRPRPALNLFDKLFSVAVSTTPHTVADRSALATARGIPRQATPGYFEAFGIRVQRGRGFSDQDTASSVPVAMVNESFVRHYLAKVDPLTQRIPTRTGSGFARSRRTVRSERHKRTCLLEPPRNGSTSNAAGVTTSGKVEILSYFADQVRPETRAD